MTDSYVSMTWSGPTGPGTGLLQWQGRINGPQIWAHTWVDITYGPRGPYRWEVHAQEDGRERVCVSCAEGETLTHAQATDPDYVLRRVLRDIDAAIEAAQEA